MYHIIIFIVLTLVPVQDIGDNDQIRITQQQVEQELVCIYALINDYALEEAIDLCFATEEDRLDTEMCALQDPLDPLVEQLIMEQERVLYPCFRECE